MEIVHNILLWHFTFKKYDNIIYTTAGLGTQWTISHIIKWLSVLSGVTGRLPQGEQGEFH